MRGKTRLLKSPPLGSGVNDLLVFSTKASFAWCCHLEEEGSAISRRGAWQKASLQQRLKGFSILLRFFFFFIIFITSNNLGQPWMTLWKIDEEEGEGMYRGWWCEKCVCVFAAAVCFLFKMPIGWTIGIWSGTALQKDFFFLHVAEARPQCLLAASLNKKKTKSYINRYQQLLLCWACRLAFKVAQPLLPDDPLLSVGLGVRSRQDESGAERIKRCSFFLLQSHGDIQNPSGRQDAGAATEQRQRNHCIARA